MKDQRQRTTMSYSSAVKILKKAISLCPLKMKIKKSHSLTLPLPTPDDPRQTGVPINCCLCRLEFMDYCHFIDHSCFSKKKVQDEVEEEEEVDYEAPWLPGGKLEDHARRYAMAAIEYLNNLGDGKKYEFVEGGPAGGAMISHGPILHINFKAKEKDCLDAQVETFFAQLRVPGGNKVVDCCVSLGPSQELPHSKYANQAGCVYCGGTIHHPTESCERLILGVKGHDLTWIYGDDYEESSDSGFEIDNSATDSDSVSDNSPDSDSGLDDDSDSDSDSDFGTSSD